MSAFMVGKTHIDAMLTAGFVLVRPYGPLRWYVGAPAESAFQSGSAWGPGLAADIEERGRELTTETADRVGAMLLAENRRSIDETELEEFYTYRQLGGTPDPVAILKAISCYSYQSCEHPEWASSEAFAFCESLTSSVIGTLKGYENAPWEISDRKVFLR